MSAWVLPDHIADVLPSEARCIEEVRRLLLDTARSYGFELVIPPLMEHLESLLSGSGSSMDLQTFKLVDQLSGRTLGIRADITPQVARIDAHLLNRSGVTRLCYCGPVLHTRVDRPHASREPIQFGAEIYGHSGLEAELEAISMALDFLRLTGTKNIQLDIADVRIVRALISGLNLPLTVQNELHRALSFKDVSGLEAVTTSFPCEIRNSLIALLDLYGEADVVQLARARLMPLPLIHQALDEMELLAKQLPEVKLSFDLADLRGHTYYSGLRFGMYVSGGADALVRGGRYDEVGAVFGRNRPAVGFSLDLKELVSVMPPNEVRSAIRAPWAVDAELRKVIQRLRGQGETVVCVLPGHESEVDEFMCDRELVYQAGQWVVVTC